ncbi:hypothetical protein ACVWYN_002966 [Pedobacter sp. UYP24]
MLHLKQVPYRGIELRSGLISLQNLTFVQNAIMSNQELLMGLTAE